MANPSLTTGKMPGETEQQYTAWLLYCEAGSLIKTLSLWNRLGQNLGETWVDFSKKLGKEPTDTTIETWSVKFRWVERRELKLTEDLAGIRKKSQELTLKKVGAISEALERISNKIIKRLRGSEEPTIDEWKKVWEMFRTEMGETLGKHDLRINEEEQKPPTPEEMELGDAIDDAIEEFYGRKRKTKK